MQFLDHFRLLQANDYLSLLTCVDFQKPVNLLHALPTRDGRRSSNPGARDCYPPLCFGSISVRGAVDKLSISRAACQREAFFFRERIARSFHERRPWKCCRSPSARPVAQTSDCGFHLILPRMSILAYVDFDFSLRPGNIDEPHRLKPVLLKNRHVRGNNPPALGKTHPDLALPP